MWREMVISLNINSKWSAHELTKRSKNIKILRHPT